MTDSITLMEMLKADCKTRRVLGDVLPVDLLPKRRLRRTPRLFIVNTDDSTGPGEHWVLVFFTGHNRGIYFDSYGSDVLDTRIQDFININCYDYVCNKRHLQGSFSLTCGQFCFYVGRRLARGFSLRRALSEFRTFNTYYNDSLVLKDFNRVLLRPCSLICNDVKKKDI